ncbi:centrosomal protein of 290 kDa-like [Spea bombifrons]|uniref:centrosomal protein of 290 kDa-like n=1 Tax=Spea bombifrons TaxID=233779 RepID=UPI00234B26DC|nr:centrosomal protein of 290 kDa-like [Spea bombifrons]
MIRKENTEASAYILKQKDRRLDEVAELKRQIDSQTESYGSVLSEKDSELQRCQGAANLLRAHGESLGAERQLLAQITEVTAQTMNRLAGIHEQSRISIQRSDRVIGELCERTNGNILQVQQLIRRREKLDEEDRNFRRFLDAQVEAWQTRLEPIDKTLEEYGRTVRSLEDELKITGKEEDDLRQVTSEDFLTRDLLGCPSHIIS